MTGPLQRSPEVAAPRHAVVFENSDRPGTAAAVLGAVLVLADTAVIAALESFLVVFRVGTVRVPLSVAIAVVTHPLLTWLIRHVTGRRLSVFLPFGVWIAIVLPLSARRAEGDLIITGNNWVSTATILCGAIAFAVGIGLLAPARRPAAGRVGGDEPA